MAYKLGPNRVLLRKEVVEEKKSGLVIMPPKDEVIVKGIILEAGVATGDFKNFSPKIGSIVHYSKYLSTNVIDKDHCVVKLEDILLVEEN